MHDGNYKWQCNLKEAKAVKWPTDIDNKQSKEKHKNTSQEQQEGYTQRTKDHD